MILNTIRDVRKCNTSYTPSGNINGHHVGLHPTGLQVLCLASFKTEESATETSMVQWMGDLKCLKQGPRATPHLVWQDMAVVFVTGGEEGYQLEEIDILLAHWLPRKPAEGHAPHCPFDKLSW